MTNYECMFFLLQKYRSNVKKYSFYYSSVPFQNFGFVTLASLFICSLLLHAGNLQVGQLVVVVYLFFFFCLPTDK